MDPNPTEQLIQLAINSRHLNNKTIIQINTLLQSGADFKTPDYRLIIGPNSFTNPLGFLLKNIVSSHNHFLNEMFISTFIKVGVSIRDICATNYIDLFKLSNVYFFLKFKDIYKYCHKHRYVVPVHEIITLDDIFNHNPIVAYHYIARMIFGSPQKRDPFILEPIQLKNTSSFYLDKNINLLKTLIINSCLSSDLHILQQIHDLVNVNKHITQNKKWFSDFITNIFHNLLDIQIVQNMNLNIILELFIIFIDNGLDLITHYSYLDNTIINIMTKVLIIGARDVFDYIVFKGASIKYVSTYNYNLYGRFIVWKYNLDYEDDIDIRCIQSHKHWLKLEDFDL